MEKELTPDTNGEKRSHRDYNLGFKLTLVSRIEKGEMTYKQAQRIYGIQGDQRSWSGCENMVV